MVSIVLIAVSNLL